MRRALTLGPIVMGGCLLTQSLDGLSGGATEGTGDASGEAAAQVDAGGDAAPGADAGVPISFRQGNAVDTSSSPTLTAPFGNPVKAHDAIIIAVAVRPTSLALMPITDTLGNAYTVVSGPWAGNGLNHYIVVALDTQAGADTVTVSLSGAPALAYVYIHEYEGLATSSAFDKASSAKGTTLTTATDGMASGFVTTTAPRELVFGFAETGTALAGTGFTVRSLFGDNVTEDRVVDVAGAYQATATMTSGSSWSMMVATFKGVQ